MRQLREKICPSRRRRKKKEKEKREREKERKREKEGEREREREFLLYLLVNARKHHAQWPLTL